jgi:hypothetical protein
VLTAALLHLFGRQRGVASDLQLMDHLTRRQIRRAVSNELFVTELPGVRRLAGVRPEAPTRIMALSLYAADDGFVSGMTAARQLGVTCVPLQYFEVMVRDRKDPHLPSWATSTRTAWRIDADRRSLAGGPTVSSPLRSLFRCAATCSDVRFEKIAEQMWHKRLITPAEASEYLELVRRKGRHGVVRFERWLQHAIDRPRPSQSALEVDLATALARLGAPTPLRQFPLPLPGGEVVHLDLAWPEVRLGLEPGATFWHGGDAKVRADHSRDRACDEIGWRILRFDEVELRDLEGCARQCLRVHRQRTREQRSARKRL